MTTLIFKDYEAFLNREDKTLNGVSEDFAKENPNYTEERNNEGCWSCSDCSYCRGCSGCSYCSDCSYCRDCRGCRGCSYCSDCRDCRDCRGCSGCSDCSYCRDCRDCRGCSDCSYCRDCRDCRGCRGCSDCSEKNGEKQEGFKIPVIENIHQKVLEAVSVEGAFDMGTWHKCDTTHCRAGWVVVLAGKEGKELEEQTDTAFAAQQIYKKSSSVHVSPTRFYETDKVAMADIQRCADEESKLQNV